MPDAVPRPADTAFPPVALYLEAVHWLNHEAALLDGLRETEWLETMVSPDIVYRMPVRQTVRRAEGTGFLDTAFHLDETYGSLSARIARTGSKFNWGEDPPSRTRHFVSNIRVIDETDGILSLVSSLLLYRTRSDQSIGSILSCERHDRLRRAAGTLRLIERIVLLDHTVVQTSNLALIF